MRVQKKIIKFTEFILFRFIIGILQIMPLKFRIGCSEGIILMVSKLMPKKVKLIESNIHHAFPDKDLQWVSDIARQNIKNMGRSIAEFLELPALQEERYNKIVINHPEKAETVRWFKDGCIVVLGHTGNWEWFGGMTSQWMPGKLYAIARRQSNPWSNSLFYRIRKAGGVETVFTDGGIKQYIRLLRDKKILCFLADQDAGKNGKFFSFLNRPASTYMGPAVISRLTGARIYFGYSFHVGNKLHTCLEELKVPSLDPKKQPGEWDIQVTRAWVSRLEEIIKEHPADYFWAHNRWKTRPDQTLNPEMKNSEI